ncbi:MAG: hypothetical protein ABI548_01325 [Polyangiaceae bacterium]
MPAPLPEEAFASFDREIGLLTSAERTGAPTQDPQSEFFGMPSDEFVECLLVLRDEIEQRAYLGIVAAVEAVVQVDFSARAKGRSSVPLAADAHTLQRQERSGRRIVLEDVLDAWSSIANARKAPISEFKQLLNHRHWLAHGRYFVNRAGVSDDPGFAIARARALLAELNRLDPKFPLAS